MTMIPAMKTKQGALTDYALSCGYKEVGGSHAVNVELWKEHGTYHVRAHNHELGCRLFWLSFQSLTKARWHFKNWVKTHTALAHL